MPDRDASNPQGGLWVIVVTDPSGVDCVAGPFRRRERATEAWQSIRRTRHPKAVASYRQIMGPVELGLSKEKS